MKIFLFVLLTAGIIVLLMQFPVLTGRGANQVKEALAKTEIIELSGKTLFISDLHLTAEPSLEGQFNLDFSSVQNVIIVGDFFHGEEHFAAFGSTEEERFRTVLQGIAPKNFSGNIFFVHALTHDPQNLQTTQLSFPNFEFYHLGRYGKFSVNGVPVVAYHGDQLHGGFAGGGMSWLAQTFGQSLLLERLGKKRFEIDQNTWVVNGHSHVSGIDHEEKVANTGSFVGAPLNKYIWRLHIGTGILFDHGTVELQEYEGLNIKKLYPFSL